MSFGTFSAGETFTATHAYAWFSSAADTAELAGEVRGETGLRLWQASLTYVKNCQPSLENTGDVRAPSAERLNQLTVQQGRVVFVRYLDAYNRLSPTATSDFAFYIDSDPAAWPDWLTCLESVD
ncbi:hypothetical protein [Herbiconiux sp.]|uniref:hypothetical protein n=1 Tax=Herbiconiux sp. TaxID=1871186 RepID=UPI0025B9DBBB|nr:hypothetical protein [Herbiconiux sp.]